jgi:prepilin-type processing-associated H-X9-DG protein
VENPGFEASVDGCDVAGQQFSGRRFIVGDPNTITNDPGRMDLIYSNHDTTRNMCNAFFLDGHAEYVDLETQPYTRGRNSDTLSGKAFYEQEGGPCVVYEGRGGRYAFDYRDVEDPDGL